MQIRRIAGFIPLIGASVYWLWWESIKHWVLEKVVHFIEVQVIAWTESLVQFGPPIILTGLGIYLFLRGDGTVMPAAPTAPPLPAAAPGAQYAIEEWQNHEVYTVWIAACLWNELPLSRLITEQHKAYPILQRLKAALVAEQIKSVYGGTGMNVQVYRTDLVRLATMWGEKPKFLFPNLPAQQILPASNHGQK